MNNPVLNNLIIQPNQLLTLYVDNQPFALNVADIQDVLVTPTVTLVPLSDEVVLGLINLRGRIVTALDLGVRLGLRPSGAQEGNMSVIVESNEELFSIVADRIGEVVEFQENEFIKNPPNLDERWKNLSSGVYKHNDILYVILSEEKICEV